MEQPTAALEKHSCPACGAQAVWTPSQQALVCAYCGTVAPVQLDRDSGKIQEIDLVKTLRELPEELRGWNAERRTVKCRSCHAVSVFEPERVGQNCDFCGSTSLVDYDEIKAPIRPQSLLPFKLDKGRVRDRVRSWFGSKWLAPGKTRWFSDSGRRERAPNALGTPTWPSPKKVASSDSPSLERLAPATM